MKPILNTSFLGIGERSTAIGVVVVQVRSRHLKFLINVLILVLKEDALTLLSIYGMIENGLDTSIQAP